jgi:hypothetical protein
MNQKKCELPLLSMSLGKDISKDENSYTTAIMVDQSPGEVFKAVNNVRGWWS